LVNRQRPSGSLSFEMVVPAGNAPASSGYQPGALLLSYRTEKLNREASVTNASRSILDLVQECHEAHRPAPGFRVYQDTVPERQGDGGMVSMAYRATCINAHVAAHLRLPQRAASGFL
jgi:hypothetical protein